MFWRNPQVAERRLRPGKSARSCLIRALRASLIIIVAVVWARRGCSSTVWRRTGASVIRKAFIFRALIL
ncbi:DUF1109 family protein [Acetobacter oeni]|nr:DUF1109 family protein [Acetobacter oeni]